MAIKYKLKLRDLKLEYLIDYIKPILKFFKPKQKINNYEELKNFIQKKLLRIYFVSRAQRGPF